MVSASEVRDFYDAFSAQLLHDYLVPNRRVLAQFDFLRDAIPRTARAILVIGCGNGHLAHFLATRVARRARILGVDISPQNISVAEHLFSHPRISYRCLDVVNEPLSGAWDVIVLPDVYEHIPAGQRSRLHEKLRPLLAENCRVLLTLPSLLHQALLRERGSGLQIVDEDVTLADLVRMGDEIDATLVHYTLISVWGVHDYAHVGFERGRTRETPIGAADQLRIHRCVPPWRAKLRLCLGRYGLWSWPWRYWRVRRGTARMRRRSAELAAAVRADAAEIHS